MEQLVTQTKARQEQQTAETKAQQDRNDAMFQDLITQSKAQQERQETMMENLAKLTQAFTEAQATANETVQKEAFDGSALEQASEAVAGIQRDVVHEEEKTAEISDEVASIAKTNFVFRASNVT